MAQRNGKHWNAQEVSCGPDAESGPGANADELCRSRQSSLYRLLSQGEDSTAKPGYACASRDSERYGSQEKQRWHIIFDRSNRGSRFNSAYE